MALVIRNATAVLKDGILEDAVVVVEDGVIQEILTECDCLPAARGTEVYDAGGLYVLPGMIDLHSDAIEKEIEPRPDTEFPLELALSHLERRLAAQGITTVLHSLSFAGGDGIRADARARDAALAIAARPWSAIRNLVHVRYEITNFEAQLMIEGLLRTGHVDLFSVMDHSPGQGQYQTIESYADYARKTYRLSDAKIAELVQDKMARRNLIDAADLADLVALALRHRVAAASHDDDSPAKVEWAHRIGIRIAEFPINLATAARATELGLAVAVGAPNVARGASHNGNLSARELIRAGYANVLCSDYYSGSLLYAVFQAAAADGDLPKAVRMVSLTPAAAIGKDRLLGSLEPGKLADLIIVGLQGGIPVVSASFVQGTPVYTGGYWRDRSSAHQHVTGTRGCESDGKILTARWEPGYSLPRPACGARSAD